MLDSNKILNDLFLDSNDLFLCKISVSWFLDSNDLFLGKKFNKSDIKVYHNIVNIVNTI